LPFLQVSDFDGSGVGDVTLGTREIIYAAN
jgi:hypothetical protein